MKTKEKTLREKVQAEAMKDPAYVTAQKKARLPYLELLDLDESVTFAGRVAALRFETRTVPVAHALGCPEVMEELDWAADLLGMVADDFDELKQPQKAASVRSHAERMRAVLERAGRLT